MKNIVTFASSCMLIAAVAISASAKSPKTDTPPTAQGAVDAEEGLTKAIEQNNADAIQSYLSDDWAVVNSLGGVAEGISVFPSGIKSGYLTRKTFATSDLRIRLYGNMALITTKVATSGLLAGKPFDVRERQTDVWIWRDDQWKCVLTHEAKIPPQGEN